MDALLDKASSVVSQAKDTVETAKTEAISTVQASVETVKSEALSAPQKLSDAVVPQVKEAVDGATSRGIEGAKSLLQSLEEKKGDVSSKLVDTVKHAAAGVSGSVDSVVSRDLPISTDNQPLLESGGQRAAESTPWWKNCCGVLDLLKTSAR